MEDFKIDTQKEVENTDAAVTLEESKIDMNQSESSSPGQNLKEIIGKKAFKSTFYIF